MKDDILKDMIKKGLCDSCKIKNSCEKRKSSGWFINYLKCDMYVKEVSKNEK